MFNFPEGLYTDIRIENVYKTKISVKLGHLEKKYLKEYTAAFIRVFDGNKWFYTSISSIDKIQDEIDSIAGQLTRNNDIYNHPQIRRLEINKEEKMIFTDYSIREILTDDKYQLLLKYENLVKDDTELNKRNIIYEDYSVIKQFFSSKGSNIKFDKQLAGITVRYSLSKGEKVFNDYYEKADTNFNNLKNLEQEILAEINKSKNFFYNSEPVKPGKYTVILSPEVAGVFAHESFGHKSESDFMLNDENMQKEWHIGKNVGSKTLSIIDDGNIINSGYTPFDDEGTRVGASYLIKSGILNDRLHSSETASALNEPLTGNSRSMNFEFEPIVRMTNTYIDKGDKTKEQLISEVENGVFLETLAHGSGMSRFTIAPRRAYKIEKGQITSPLFVSVITGSVMETLHKIDGISDQVIIKPSINAGCGKFEQYPLPVSFGGPFIRVIDTDVQ